MVSQEFQVLCIRLMIAALHHTNRESPEHEWRSLLLSSDTDRFLSQDTNTESFWSKVHTSGKYPTLSKSARALLSILIPNTDCGRIFSLINNKKDEKRNRLSNVSLTNELLCGEGIRKAGECT